MATKAVRSTSARIAAHSRWAEQDPVAGTAPARRGFMARFERQVDPERVLDAKERHRRATSAMRAHMSQLALKSAKRRAAGTTTDQSARRPRAA